MDTRITINIWVEQGSYLITWHVSLWAADPSRPPEITMHDNLGPLNRRSALGSPPQAFRLSVWNLILKQACLQDQRGRRKRGRAGVAKADVAWQRQRAQRWQVRRRREGTGRTAAVRQST